MDKRRLDDLGLLRSSRSTNGLVGTVITRAIIAIRTSTIAIRARTSGGRGSSHGGGRGRNIHRIDGMVMIVVMAVVVQRRTRQRIGRGHGRGEHRNTASRAGAMSGDCGSKGDFGRVSETAHVAPEREQRKSKDGRRRSKRKRGKRRREEKR